LRVRANTPVTSFTPEKANFNDFSRRIFVFSDRSDLNGLRKRRPNPDDFAGPILNAPWRPQLISTAPHRRRNASIPGIFAGCMIAELRCFERQVVAEMVSRRRPAKLKHN
jgi:hypothetical protein